MDGIPTASRSERRAGPRATPQRSPLVSQVIEILRDAISEGRWPVGTKLPVEAELATEYGISRTTLRQAIQALVHVGLLETIQGNGTFVRGTVELDAVLSRYLAGESETAVLEVRLALETTAAALAAERATSEQIEAIIRAIGDADDAIAGGLSDAVASTRVHAAIVSASSNPILRHFYEVLEAATTRTMRETSSPEPPERFQDDHRGIVQAIRDRDPDEARRLAHEHLMPVIEAAREAGGATAD
ncbi:FadR/GntR family transcriptional regulator [Gordonia sp. MP11Mi]|uniref:L-lactate dehydrogenase operon regulatory protein n=1 Tax=Gordonia sp. MP11Mi TaxID=3022769 RepID=A0AA97CW02_9ACTN